MTIRNHVQSHLVKRPCNKCHKPTLALNNKTGVLEIHPVCESCKNEYAQKFAQAANAPVRYVLVRR